MIAVYFHHYFKNSTACHKLVLLVLIPSLMARCFLFLRIVNCRKNSITQLCLCITPEEKCNLIGFLFAPCLRCLYVCDLSCLIFHHHYEFSVSRTNKFKAIFITDFSNILDFSVLWTPIIWSIKINRKNLFGPNPGHSEDSINMVRMKIFCKYISISIVNSGGPFLHPFFCKDPFCAVFAPPKTQKRVTHGFQKKI